MLAAPCQPRPGTARTSPRHPVIAARSVPTSPHPACLQVSPRMTQAATGGPFDGPAVIDDLQRSRPGRAGGACPARAPPPHPPTSIQVQAVPTLLSAPTCWSARSPAAARRPAPRCAHLAGTISSRILPEPVGDRPGRRDERRRSGRSPDSRAVLGRRAHPPTRRALPLLYLPLHMHRLALRGDGGVVAAARTRRAIPTRVASARVPRQNAAKPHHAGQRATRQSGARRAAGAGSLRRQWSDAWRHP